MKQPEFREVQRRRAKLVCLSRSRQIQENRGAARTASKPFDILAEALAYSAKGATLHIDLSTKENLGIYSKPSVWQPEGGPGVVRLGGIP